MLPVTSWIINLCLFCIDYKAVPYFLACSMLISSYKLDCDVVIKIMLSAYLNFSDNSSSDTKSTGIGLTLQRLSHNKTT